MRKLFSFLCSVMLIAILCVPVSALDEGKSNDIVILYINDVHANIDRPLSYDTIGAIKKQLEKEYRYVLLVDAGDHLQGTEFGSLDKGATIVQLMNKAGFDLAVPGNHDFDYGMDTFLKRTQEAEFPYLSCNFYHQSDGVRGERLLEPFHAYHFGKEIVAFIGITTPETILNAVPAHFQDESGSFCYEISGSESGIALYDEVQNTVNAVRRAGATKVIAVGHLGDDPSSSPWTSEEVIANVSGLDAFIDGHSHSMIRQKQVLSANGTTTLLTQAGENLNKVGIMIIDYETGEIRSDLIDCNELQKTVTNKDGSKTSQIVGYQLSSELYGGPDWPIDYTIAAQKNQWIKKVNLAMKQKIGETNVVLENFSEDGKQLACMQETNTGDFAADAIYYLFDQMDMDVDGAIVYGGGIRNESIKGVMTYKTCMDIQSFSDAVCLQIITGQQLLDALEWGARGAGSGEECNGFLQVSGIRYQVDTQWPDSTQKSDDGFMWIGGPTGGYRVHDVEIYDKATDGWKPLDTQANYRIAGSDYILRNSGNGYTMFSSGVNVIDYVMRGYMVLANYVQAFEDNTVKASNSPLLEKYPSFGIDYGAINGSGRIVFAEGKHDPMPSEEVTVPTEVTETAPAETVEKLPVEAESAPFPVLPLVIAIMSLAAIFGLIVYMRKKPE